MLLSAAKSSLLIVDMQERLLPAMVRAEEAERRCSILLKVSKMLGVPVAASEQYPKGLGHTVSGLRREIGNVPVFEKICFSCWRDDAIKAHLIKHYERGRPQAIIAGIEAHVCVLQTAIDMAQAGFAVFAVADAMSSRAEASVTLALDRMRLEGVRVINTEMAVFELLGKAGTPEFKAASGLIK
jgi:nicotinamidase-related amidase